MGKRTLGAGPPFRTVYPAVVPRSAARTVVLSVQKRAHDAEGLSTDTGDFG